MFIVLSSVGGFSGTWVGERLNDCFWPLEINRVPFSFERVRPVQVTPVGLFLWSCNKSAFQWQGLSGRHLQKQVSMAIFYNCSNINLTTYLLFHLGSYSLSIRDYAQEQGDVVKHYKIRCLDKGGYYISPSNTFPTLQELVKYYSRK